jgi:hypothetical protein
LKSTLTLGFGIFLVLLALVTATGAVSLGSSTYPIGNGQAGQNAWLVYSPLVFLLSLALAGGGIAIIYLTGREAAVVSRLG